MTKTEVIKVFGSQAAIAKALGISRSAVSQWNEFLTPDNRTKVIAAASILGIEIPESWKRSEQSA